MKIEKNLKRATGISKVLFELLAEVVGIELKKKHKKVVESLNWGHVTYSY